MQFLFVSPNVCRQLLSDSPSRRTPLLLANTPYCKAHSGLTPYSLYPCLTHKINPGGIPGFVKIQYDRSMLHGEAEYFILAFHIQPQQVNAVCDIT